MTDIEINKRIYGLMGLCWHYWTFTGPKQGTFKCIKCGEFKDNPSSNLNFTGDWKISAYEFGLLWTWLQKHERWEEFWLKRLENVARNRSETIMVMCQIISPPTLSRAVVEFFEAPHD